MWLSKTENSLVWWGFEDASAKIIVANGLTYVVEPPVKGAKHNGSTSVTLTIKGDNPQVITESFKGEYTIDAIESVTVPAGTFADCIKVHEVEVTPDGTADFYVWYAPNVGPVKYSYPLRNNRIDVLTEYNIVNDDPFESWLLPMAPYLIIYAVVIAVVAVVVIVLTVYLLKRRKQSNKQEKKEEKEQKNKNNHFVKS